MQLAILTAPPGSTVQPKDFVVAEKKPEDNDSFSRNATSAKTYRPSPPFAKLLVKTPMHPYINIVTCFDGHLDPRNFSGLQPEDTVLISNADALRSLIVLDDLLRVNRVTKVHHTDCGLIHTSNELIRAKLDTLQRILNLA